MLPVVAFTMTTLQTRMKIPVVILMTTSVGKESLEDRIKHKEIF